MVGLGFVFARTREGQLEALSALATIGRGDSRKGEADVVATANRKWNLACASSSGTAITDALGVEVAEFGFSVGVALLCFVSVARICGPRTAWPLDPLFVTIVGQPVEMLTELEEATELEERTLEEDDLAELELTIC